MKVSTVLTESLHNELKDVCMGSDYFMLVANPANGVMVDLD